MKNPNSNYLINLLLSYDNTYSILKTKGNEDGALYLIETKQLRHTNTKELRIVTRHDKADI